MKGRVARPFIRNARVIGDALVFQCRSTPSNDLGA